MKKSILISFLSFFIFVGCIPKQEVVVPKDNQSSKEVVIKEPIIEEKKEPIIMEPEPVVESSTTSRIAILYPSKIVGKYAKSTVGTVSAFLIYSDKEFFIETFDTYDENPENIINEVLSLKEKGFNKVIALVTENGFNTLNDSYEVSSDLTFYFPLIHKSEIQTNNENFIFGAISYEEQMQILKTISTEKNTMFFVKSYIGNRLKEIYERDFGPDGIIKEIEPTQNNYKYIMDDERIIENTILLNTPIVKSAIILSQLTAYEINPVKVLSTQLNYNPLIIKLTQEHDRNSLLVVNSISKIDSFLSEYTTILDSDINYNWVDYSSLVGVNYLLNENNSEIIPNKVIDNQVEYKPEVYKVTSYGFEKLED